MPATAVSPARPSAAPSPGLVNRPSSAARPSRAGRGKPGNPRRGPGKPRGGQPSKGEAEHDILFQKFFKSVGPRTYAAQVKRATNGNHYLVLMEGKRDDATGEVRKTRLFVYSEDFVEFFRLVKSAAEFIKANPLPADVAAKRERFWAKQAAEPSGGAPRAPTSGVATAPPPRSAAASAATRTPAPASAGATAMKTVARSDAAARA